MEAGHGTHHVGWRQIRKGTIACGPQGKEAKGHFVC